MPDPGSFSKGPSKSAQAPLDAAWTRADDQESPASGYRALFDAITDGFCVVEVLFDESGQAADHRFIHVNPAFEEQAGIRDPVGRRASEVFPGTEREWFDVFGEVTKTGKPARLTREAANLERIYEVQAFRVDDPALAHVGVLFRDITSRVREDNAVRASRLMLSTVVDSIPAAVAVVRGSDLRLELVNAQYQSFAPGKVMRGKTLNEVWPESGEDFGRICRKVLETGEPYDAVDQPYSIRRAPDAPLELRHFTWSLKRIALPDGEGWGLLNTGWETTERKRTEESARANELRYRNLFEQVPDGIFLADAAGRYIDVNPAGCRLLGLSRSEVLSRSIGDVILPEERARLPAEVARFGDGVIAHSEWKFQRKDGSVFIGEVTGRRNADGNLQGVLRDVTETRLIEEAVRESEERFRSLADDHPLIIWVHDADGGLSYVNRTYCAYFGITAEEALEQRWRVLTHPDDGDAYANEFFACAAERRQFHGLVRVRRADGKWRWLESWARPRFSAERFLGMVGSSADITERRQAEDSLKDADRRKDEFLALLAHELRNPLAPLRTGIELLRLGKQDERLAEQALSIMQRQVEHMVRLIDDLLDVSRIARGKLELRREATNLRDVLKAAMETSDPAVKAGRHELRTAFDLDDVQVEGDAVRLAQVFSNLLNNAARYTRPGGHIALTVRHEAGQAIVAVEDDGIGIAGSMLEQVFEPFVQVKSEERNAHGGLGLGLSLARSLVELHGGSIRAESAGRGKGSRFTVQLPSIRPPGRQETASAQGAMSTLQRHRVMVVDDNSDAADTLAIWLRSMGQDVRVAYDGPSALSEAAKFEPQFVLLDLGMPGMDGYEVARRLRSMSLTPSPVLVALTGYGQASDRKRTAEAGFVHHAVKPVDPQVLLAHLAGARPLM
jgi:PAS domain S-box-containing protein